MSAPGAGWRRWVEPWYLAYALLGVAAAGLVPIVLPLAISRMGGAAEVGLVMATVSVGGLSAPLWGSLADRARLHRWVLAGGLLGATAALAALWVATTTAAWLGLALALGIGVAAAATVANLFVVEAHPQAEWDERIGWLQTFYGGGQVGGLLLAGGVSLLDPRDGLVAAAIVTALAVGIGWATTPTLRRRRTPKPVLLHPPRHSEWPVASPQRLYHHVDLTTLRRLGPALRSPFGRLLATWLVCLAGSTVFFSLYPVLMRQVYGVAPALAAAGFAAAAGLGLALYAPAARWSDRLGPTRVLQAAVGVRAIAYLGLAGLAIVPISGREWLAVFGFTWVVLAWSLLSVSGTALAARLSPVGEGAGMGIFNATTALAGTLGAGLGGWVAEWWGYPAAVGLALAGVVLGLLLTLTLRPAPPARSPLGDARP